MRFWPRSIRLIHWGLALTILFDAFILEDAPHRYAGYAALAFVFARLALKFTLKEKIPKARNNLALTIYLLMWLDVIALALTGWMLGTDEYFGDESIGLLHNQMSDGLMVLIFLHLAGLGIDAYRFKRKSWMGMISGRV